MGGGSFEELSQIQDSAIEELIERPHIIEWANDADSDGVALMHLNGNIMF